MYFAKQLRRATDAQRLVSIHQKLLNNGFNQLVPILRIEQDTIIIQPWQDNSRVANFSNKEDRLASLTLLNRLHIAGQNVTWQDVPFIPTAKALLKWQLRFIRFKQELPMLSYYFPKKWIQQLVQYGEKSLADIYQAEGKGETTTFTLLHGDVVHHNFLVCSDDCMRLIDFDLAQVGEPEDELLLWMHRVLPNMHYQLPQLLEEQQALKAIPKAKMHRLKYPNELLREWLYVLTLEENEREPFLDYLFPFTENALSYWPKLWYDSNRYATT